MRLSPRERQIVFSIIVFVVVDLVGTLAGMFLARLISSSQCTPVSPGDSCDGPAMAGMAIFVAAFPVSVILALIAAVATAFLFPFENSTNRDLSIIARD
jgi:hypothetical protein